MRCWDSWAARESSCELAGGTAGQVRADPGRLRRMAADSAWRTRLPVQYPSRSRGQGGRGRHRTCLFFFFCCRTNLNRRSSEEPKKVGRPKKEKKPRTAKQLANDERQRQRFLTLVFMSARLLNVLEHNPIRKGTGDVVESAFIAPLHNKEVEKPHSPSF